MANLSLFLYYKDNATTMTDFTTNNSSLDKVDDNTINNVDKNDTVSYSDEESSKSEQSSNIVFNNASRTSEDIKEKLDTEMKQKSSARKQSRSSKW